MFNHSYAEKSDLFDIVSLYCYSYGVDSALHFKTLFLVLGVNGLIDFILAFATLHLIKLTTRPNHISKNEHHYNNIFVQYIFHWHTDKSKVSLIHIGRQPSRR